MTSVAATTLATIQAVQLALTLINTQLGFETWKYPATCTPENGSYYDFIVVGAGSGGSTVASRLSANPNVSVLLIEAGGVPPLESAYPGVFPVLPESAYDFNYTSVNDNYTAQNLQNSTVSMTSGKMLGGSSSLNHMIYVEGDPHDFNIWALLLNDTAWNYTNVQKYFKKQQKLMDPGLLNSSYYSELHGKDGPIIIARELHQLNKNLLLAFEELGHNIVEDVTSDNSSLGCNEPLFHIGEDQRQNAALAYLRMAISRTNLCLAMSTTATKILIENNTAVGVEVTDSSGDTKVFYTNKEVIVSAGAISSPKLLMLSGIGPKEHLESLGINVVADLPVGENLQDHPCAPIAYQLEEDTSTTPATNPHQFPVPTSTLYAAVNASQTYPDYQSINLLFPHDSAALLQLASKVFKYSVDICDTLYSASAGRRLLFAIVNLMIPKSTGKILLQSSDPTADLLIYTGTYSNSSDLTLMVESLKDFHRVINTTYFTGINATLVDLGLCDGLSVNTDPDEFWKCYALGISATMWHYAGTCSMGKVTDTNLSVKDVGNLRVVDASVMPTLTSGNINAAIWMIAEFAAEKIAESWGLAI